MDTKTRQTIDVLMESDDRMDKFAVCVKINEKIVGHLKKRTSRSFANTIFYFLCSDAYSSAWAKLTGNGEGMQLSSKLSLSGQPKYAALLRKELMKMKKI